MYAHGYKDRQMAKPLGGMAAQSVAWGRIGALMLNLMIWFAVAELARRIFS